MALARMRGGGGCNQREGEWESGWMKQNLVSCVLIAVFWWRFVFLVQSPKRVRRLNSSRRNSKRRCSSGNIFSQCARGSCAHDVSRNNTEIISPILRTVCTTLEVPQFSPQELIFCTHNERSTNTVPTLSSSMTSLQTIRYKEVWEKYKATMGP